MNAITFDYNNSQIQELDINEIDFVMGAGWLGDAGAAIATIGGGIGLVSAFHGNAVGVGVGGAMMIAGGILMLADAAATHLSAS
ncbi:hypothetical protein KFE96_00510 [Kordiimonas sp. SCSIO 12603]|uniref:hypothetical protein n=1 Tax=Kordiimonas sp. SCSIO 12603 TaxID=2829596 RepID=UPI002106E801|nr:hypothetical protein [Kordiimonas sp. SCSIO 12603]UTW58825.1 hypothetical protein KFE96_00510 [Kordiimonas sp. SCSIO 12603]